MCLGTLGTMEEVSEGDGEPQEGTGAYFLQQAIARLLDFSDLDADAPRVRSYETDPDARPDPVFLAMVEGTLDPRNRPPLEIRRVKESEDMSPIAVRLREIAKEKHGPE